jgi:hypothetical protein
VGLSHVLGWTEMEGSTKILRLQPITWPSRPLGAWALSRLRRDRETSCSASAAKNPRIGFRHRIDLPLRIFVPFHPPKFQACICHVHPHDLGRSKMRSSQWQGFSLAHWLRGRAPETLLICDLVALWLEGERMKGRGARNPNTS